MLSCGLGIVANGTLRRSSDVVADKRTPFITLKCARVCMHYTDTLRKKEEASNKKQRGVEKYCGSFFARALLVQHTPGVCVQE